MLCVVCVWLVGWGVTQLQVVAVDGMGLQLLVCMYRMQGHA